MRRQAWIALGGVVVLAVAGGAWVAMQPGAMPFDAKRMIFGGFKSFIDMRGRARALACFRSIRFSKRNPSCL